MTSMIEQNALDISFLVPAKNASAFLEKTLISIYNFLESNFASTYEIILILNGEDETELSLMNSIAQSFLKDCPHLKICSTNKSGKGAALRAGFQISTGKNIFFTDADLPYDLDFFIEANLLLKQGYHLISGNRRFADSRFTLPVSVLPIAYSRHRIGLLFNKVVRTLFKINSIDTQAGIKAFSRKLAERLYSLDTCPGFLFDVELFLIAKQNGFKRSELPVHLHLKTEKTTVRLIKESYHTLIWLSKFLYQNLKGYYHFESEMNFKENYYITADDWGLSPSVNRGILSLVKKGIITRVSILADGLYINDYLDELKSIEGIELGVHFNLTYEKKYESPLHLLLTSFNPIRNKKNNHYVQQELIRQFEIFKNLGIHISYADGHHHCHIFPITLKPFLKFLKENNIRQSRLPIHWSFLFSSKIILLIFSLRAKRQFKKFGINYRPFFYPEYSKIKSSEELRNQLLYKIGYEIISHPSDLADLALLAINDQYDHERVKEFHLFNNLIPDCSMESQ